ncbi:MAG: hypothetical protein K2X00_16870 [Nitrospiraceae bacterium]|nr:hypothetical protein [Nitrospiraceae bacterium]
MGVNRGSIASSVSRTILVLLAIWSAGIAANADPCRIPRLPSCFGLRMRPSSCVVLVPVGGAIEPGCEQALHVLERRGYPVRRVMGFSAIDFGRSVLASNALADGFDEMMWVQLIPQHGFQTASVKVKG